MEGHESLSVEKYEMTVQVSGNYILSDSGLISFYQDDTNYIIDSNFKETDYNTFSFEVEEYNPERVLIIDPLVFSTFIGGEGEVAPRYSNIDSMGNINLYGSESSLDMFTTPGAYQDTYGGGSLDSFVKKLKNDGSDLIFSTYIGGNGKDEIRYSRFDPAGNLILFGRTESTNFPTTEGAYDETFNGAPYDTTITKLKRGWFGPHLLNIYRWKRQGEYIQQYY